MVNEFLDTLSNQLRPMAENDFKVMGKMKNEEIGVGAGGLAAWDTAYFTAKYKKKFLQVSTSEFTPYFSLGGCMEGLNNLMQSLYGISLENTEMNPGESWAQDIYKLTVKHESEGVLGHIYCDLFDRTGKPNQDCHFTIQGGKSLPDGSYQVILLIMHARLGPNNIFLCRFYYI